MDFLKIIDLKRLWDFVVSSMSILQASISHRKTWWLIFMNKNCVHIFQFLCGNKRNIPWKVGLLLSVKFSLLVLTYSVFLIIWVFIESYYICSKEENLWFLCTSTLLQLVTLCWMNSKGTGIHNAQTDETAASPFPNTELFFLHPPSTVVT